MTRLAIVNLVLLLAVATLAAVVYFRPSRNESAARSLSERLPPQARSVTIERDGSPAIVLKRQDETWRIVEPLRAEADAEQVQRLLGILTAIPAQRFEASRLERFDLERPRTRLTIDDESFQFGMVNSVSGEQYVLAGNAVHAVASRYGAALPQQAIDMARKQLLSRAETPVRFEMGEFALHQEQERWLMFPARSSLSQDALASWVEMWRSARASRVAPFLPRSYTTELRVGLKSGAAVTLGVIQREPELVIAREDEKLQYHFPAASAQRLLAPPGQALGAANY